MHIPGPGHGHGQCTCTGAGATCVHMRICPVLVRWFCGLGIRCGTLCTVHGQRTSASCAVSPCAFTRRGRGAHAHARIPLPKCTFATACAATTIPPAPGRGGGGYKTQQGVQNTATKAQFNRIDKCPKLQSASEPNAGLRHKDPACFPLRRCLLRGCCRVICCLMNC